MSSEIQFFGAGYGNCAFCDSPLNVHEHIKGYCGSFQCHSKAAVRDNQEKTARKKNELNTLAREMLSSVHDSEDAESVPIVITPSNDNELVRLPAARLASFVKHLFGLFSGIVDNLGTDFRIPDSEQPVHGIEEESVYESACELCRGKCCLQGYSAQAFISENTIRRQLAHIDEDHLRELYMRYIQLIPDFSHENSCLYHSKTGCSLPRSMRSEICNDYLCEHLSCVDCDRVVKAKKIFYVAEVDFKPVRSALIVSDA